MAMRPLSDSDAACGGKAVALAHLIDAELPVPDGFVLDRAAFEAAAGLIDLAGDLASDPAGDLASHPTGDLADHLTGHPAGDPTGARDVGHALAAAAARIEASAPPAELADAVAERAAELGSLAVRSSAT